MRSARDTQIVGFAERTSTLLRQLMARTTTFEEMLSAAATGWGNYTHTGSSQSLTANIEATLTNNKGSVIETQKPTDITTFYDATRIPGRNGDGVIIRVGLNFTPTSALASVLRLAIDIGAGPQLFPRYFPLTMGSGIAHPISYELSGYMGATWAANGGLVKILADGPGTCTAMSYVITRTHKAR